MTPTTSTALPFDTSGTGGISVSTDGGSIQHELGQLFGGFLNALPGYSTLGSQITDPSVNYQGATNPGYTAPAPATAGTFTDTVTPPPTPPPTPIVDPLAKARADFNASKQGIFSSVNDSVTGLQPQYANNVSELVQGLRLNQQGIDRSSQQNDASRILGNRNIMDMIGQGIKSAGAYLGGRNAGSSSAAGAIAQAYGELGRRQSSSVGNQYAQNQQNIGLQQEQQNLSQTSTKNKFHLDMINNVNSIVASAQEKFAQLNAAAATASLPDRIAIDQEKEVIRQQILGQLQQYDTQLQQQVGGLAPQSADQTRTAANQLVDQGQADPNMFNYSTEAPLTAQNSGPSASGLPLYTAPKKQLQF